MNKIIGFFIKYLLIFGLILQVNNAFTQNLRGLYVDDFKHIIGNSQKENDLLEYAQKAGFNYLILYNTSYIHRNLFPLDSQVGSAVWSSFIYRAKTKFGINEIGIVGEKAASFLPAIKYNANTDNPTHQIDVFNLEFEFWNKRLYSSQGYYCQTYLTKENYSCTNSGAFEFYKKQLQEMRKLVSNSSIKIETYVGNPTDNQIFQIGSLVDRLLIHYYRTDVKRIASYKINRLQTLQKLSTNLIVVPIFSSRENHLATWLKSHQHEQINHLFYTDLKQIQEIDTNLLHFDGIVWYRYSDMPKNK
ncbi:MAG: hypothetical protein JW729_09860 [Bacteroidales bacterium]|nr:hypothetical protein [Bacteroidales bacterium]